MSPQHEATILEELRRTHAQLVKTPPSSTPAGRDGHHGWSMRLTVEEVDLLLKIVDERDELRRQLVGDWEPPFPPATVVPHTQEWARAATSFDIDGCSIPMTPEQIAPFTDGREARECPLRDTIHDCPLGGCANDSPRESDVPDLPHEDRAAFPAPAGSVYAVCVICSGRVVQGPGHSAWRHLVIGGYGAPHEARPHA